MSLRRSVRLEPIALIAVGGFAGANLRYAVESVVPSSLAATLLVNVAGSFALGGLLYGSRHVGTLSERARYVFGTGFLSSFTTYSAFVLDAVTAAPATAVAYVLASYALGFAAVLAARTSVRRLTEPRLGEAA